MKFEVYCDETHADLVTPKPKNSQAPLVGSLWLPADLREEVKSRIVGLREQHRVHGEMKWRKVSPSKVDFYIDLVDLFVSFGPELRFRCLAVERKAMNVRLRNSEAQLGIYMYYYLALQHWILDQNEYAVFCDLKTNRDRTRLASFRRVLNDANHTSAIANVQFLPSSEVVLLQLCDVLLGAVSARIIGRKDLGEAKESVIVHLEQRLDQSRLQTTATSEKEFDVMALELTGW